MTAMLPNRSSSDPSGQCVLAGRRSTFGPITRLTTLSAELAELPIGPDAAFRADLRARLLDEAARATHAPRPPVVDPPRGPIPDTARRRYGRRVTAAGLAVVLTGGGVAAAAAARSLPGEPLYPAKRLGQSVRMALDPASGATTSLRLLSSRISEVEQTAAIDPTGADLRRWRGVDMALGDVDRLLVGLTASEPGQALRTSLSPDRSRLERLVVAVPASHRDGVRRLLDTIDGLTTVLPDLGGAGQLPVGILPTDRVSPSGALAAGWPLDLSWREPSPGLPGAADGDSPAGSAASLLSLPGTGTGAGSADTATSSGSPTDPADPLRLPSGAAGQDSYSPTSSRQVLPGSTGGLGTVVDRAIGGSDGGATDGSSGSGSTSRPSSGGRLINSSDDSASDRPVRGTVLDVLGAGTDTAGPTSADWNVLGSTSSR